VQHPGRRLLAGSQVTTDLVDALQIDHPIQRLGHPPEEAPFARAERAVRSRDEIEQVEERVKRAARPPTLDSVEAMTPAVRALAATRLICWCARRSTSSPG
jgi:hypothetical protein